MTCGADTSDPNGGALQRSALKELFESLAVTLEGRYRLTDMLGRGGMGAVFLAEDLRLGRKVALKVLRPELAADEDFVRRFEREARIAASLEHENIIPLYAVEQVGAFHYFTMKYVNGSSLDGLLAEGRIPIRRARDLLIQAAAGLGYAHLHGVIHRDVKPPNLMLDQSGRVLVTDFGISKALQAETQYTSTGQMVGTPNYLSPEQAQSLPVDGRSDQYSLACVGYRMVVGRLPFKADSVHALLYKHIHELPMPARQAEPDVPADLSDVLHRALSKDPAQRFASMEDFAAAVQGQSVSAGSDRVSEPPRAGRDPRALTLVAAVLMLVGVAVGVSLWRSGQVESADIQSPGHGAAPAVSPIRPDTAALSAPVPHAPAAGDTSRSPSAPPVPHDSVAKARPTPPRPKPSAAPPAAASAESLTPAPSRGYLTVNAVPYGTVSIDGVEVGDTPVVGHELPPGPHKVRITREGFRPETTTVVITGGNEIRLSRTLVAGP
jgi:serine/threonine-protein kinase